MIFNRLLSDLIAFPAFRFPRYCLLRMATLALGWLVFILTLLPLPDARAQTQNGVPLSEYNALVALYNSTNGPAWINHTNWLTSADVSQWYGVIVSNGRVGALSLQANNLVGVIPAPVADLTALASLFISDNQLTNVQDLPPGLQYLDCKDNQLSSLPLPVDLHYLNCNSNLLTNLPVLPANLQYLACARNQLTSLPILPNGLQNLLCDENRLTSLPALPVGLQYFFCKVNQLTSLPALPAGLQYFDCALNQLTSLPALPDGLQTLYCDQNLLTNLPALPTNLQKLYCGVNQLTFQHLEPNISKLPDAYYYTPQADIGPTENLSVASGGNLSLSADFAGSSLNNRYQWYKDGVVLTGATSVTYIIANANVASAGSYTCQLTNTVVTGLKLKRRPITVTVNSCVTPITVTPNVTICAGAATILSAAALDACNNSLSFDGVDDYLQVGDKASLKMSNTMTIEAWIYPTGAGSATNGGIIVNKEGEYMLARWTDGTIRWAFANTFPGWTFFNTNVITPLNTWSHIAITYKAGYVNTYLNGVLMNIYVGLGSVGDVQPSANDFRMGGRQSVTQYFQGSIDEVRVWNTVRTSLEVKSAMNTSVPANEPGLSGYWKLNEGAGSTAIDATANASTGILTNGTNWLTSSHSPVYPTFTWSPATGLRAITGTSVTAQPSTTTTYTVTDGNSSASVTVKVTPPSLTVSPDVSVCLGTATTLTASSNAFCNNALAFDGIDDYVNVNPLLTSVTNTFTVEAWVNPTATHEIDDQSTTGVTGFNDQRYLIFPTNGDTWATDHAGMGISVGTNGVSVYEHANNYMPALLVWKGKLNGWTHLAVVYTNKQPSLYINGVLVKTGKTSTKSYVHVSTGFGGGPYGYFKGSIDELRIWNMNRTASQIQTAKNTSLLGTTPGLVGYWKLNEGIGSTVVDATASNNTGTLSKGFNSLSWVSNLLIPPLTTTTARWEVPSTAPVYPTFTWSPTTGLSTTTGASVTATLTNPSTTYTVTDGVSTASVTVTTAQCGGRLSAEEVEVSKSSGEVYPNPFAGKTQLYIRTVEPEPLTIVISDLQGRVIDSSTAHQTNEIISIGEGMTLGVYLLRAVHGNSVKVFKIIKSE